MGLDYYPTQPLSSTRPASRLSTSEDRKSVMESPLASSSRLGAFPSSLNGRDSRRREEDLVYLFEAEEERITNLLSRKLEKVRGPHIHATRGIGMFLTPTRSLVPHHIPHLAEGGESRARKSFGSGERSACQSTFQGDFRIACCSCPTTTVPPNHWRRPSKF